MKSDLVNLSFYKFYQVGTPETLTHLRLELLKFCKGLDLKGTILLSTEGLNGMLSGSRLGIDEFLKYARDTLALEDEFFKETAVTEDSFHRMLVKIKKEIISVGDPDLKPYEKTAPKLSASEFKKWIEDGLLEK